MASFIEDDLSDLLSSGGVTTTIFKEFLPPSPDDAILIRVTGAYPPIRAMGSPARSGGIGAGMIVIERPTVQVVRRSPSALRAEAEMNYIFNFLDGVGDRTINGTRYNQITALQSPFPLAQDETKRTERVCNFLIEKYVSTATST